jgi:hypothetical protein
MSDAGPIQPGGIQPPVNDPPLPRAGGQFSEAWTNFFQDIADRINAGNVVLHGIVDSAGSTTAVIMQTGTGTSDPAGLISVTLPTPYTTRTLDFQCDGSPDEANAYFNQGTVVALPLDVITGTLSVLDTGTGSVVSVPNTDFTWFATGV